MAARKPKPKQTMQFVMEFVEKNDSLISDLINCRVSRQTFTECLHDVFVGHMWEFKLSTDVNSLITLSAFLLMLLAKEKDLLHRFDDADVANTLMPDLPSLIHSLYLESQKVELTQ